MPLNLTKPVVTDSRSAVLQYVRENITALSRMLDGETITGAVDGTIRYNSTAKQFQRYSGGAWTALDLGFMSLAGGVMTGALTVSSSITVSGAYGALRMSAQSGSGVYELAARATDLVAMSAFTGGAVFASWKPTGAALGSLVSNLAGFGRAYTVDGGVSGSAGYELAQNSVLRGYLGYVNGAVRLYAGPSSQLELYTGGVSRGQMTATGALLIGTGAMPAGSPGFVLTTPWRQAAFPNLLRIGYSGSAAPGIAYNLRFSDDGGGAVYADTTGTSSLLQLAGGEMHAWRGASATAGNTVTLVRSLYLGPVGWSSIGPVATASPLAALHVGAGAYDQALALVADAGRSPFLSIYTGGTRRGVLVFDAASSALKLIGETPSGDLWLGTDGVHRGRIGGLGSWFLGTGALSAGATAGYVHIPEIGGAPGTPSDAVSGLSAIAVDSANSRLCVRVNGTWKFISL